MARIVRRETHSSRAVLAGIAALIITLLAIYALLESTLRAVGQPPWLLDPLSAAQAIADLPEGIPALLLGALGAVLLMLGLIFFLNAVLPGKRARHTLPDRRAAVVVDDEVIASALARRARLTAGVIQEQVVVVVSQREVVVNVRPTSGIPVDEAAIRSAVEEEVRTMTLVPEPAVRVHLAAAGVIGV
ncbi:MAG TPA: DUF6286 domain-containing protein [Micrococcaceae bacterium]|jgi:hypothetical protein|nr:DUF6286 domain-containing protein [Micrococcaceae bacterium]